MRQFKHIGNSFHFSGGLTADYHGPIIASPDAFYLVIRFRPDEGLASKLGGSAGLFAVKAIRSFLGTRQDALEFKYADLPVEITAHPDWPLKQRDGSVIVIPRNVIQRIRYSFWSTYDLICGERTYCIGLHMVRRRSVMAALREMGWDEKLDSSDSSSLWVQLAPLWGLFAGAAIGTAIRFVPGLPFMAQRDTAFAFTLIGTLIGLIAGSIFCVRGVRRAARTVASDPKS